MKEEDYSYDNLKKMTYIDCVEKETSRFYGPVNMIFSRITINNHFLKEVPIRKGTLLGIQSLGFHYS